MGVDCISFDHKSSLFTSNSLSLTILLKTKSQKKGESGQRKSVSGIASDLFSYQSTYIVRLKHTITITFTGTRFNQANFQSQRPLPKHFNKRNIQCTTGFVQFFLPDLWGLQNGLKKNLITLEKYNNVVWAKILLVFQA